MLKFRGVGLAVLMSEVYGLGAGFVNWGLGTFWLLSSGFGWVSDSQTSGAQACYEAVTACLGTMKTLGQVEYRGLNSCLYYFGGS